MTELFLYVASLLSGFGVTYLATPFLVRGGGVRGLTGTDLHKSGDRQVVKLGGVSMVIGFLSAATVAGLLPLDDSTMLAILLSSVLGVLIGMMDDLFDLRKRVLVGLAFFAGVPAVTFRLGSPTIHSWPGGPIDLGPFFWLLVPLTFAFLMNGVNIYAGFNGLEAGLALVTAVSLGLSAVILGSLESALALFALSAVLLGFLRWNYFPAKIFPGNSGTYFVGATIAAAIIAGDIRLAGVIATLPYTFNFLLRFRDRFRWTVGAMDAEGLVVSEKLNALWAVWIHNTPRSESQVVLLCWLLQFLFGAAAVLFSLQLSLL